MGIQGLGKTWFGVAGPPSGHPPEAVGVPGVCSPEGTHTDKTYCSGGQNDMLHTVTPMLTQVAREVGMEVVYRLVPMVTAVKASLCILLGST